MSESWTKCPLCRMTYLRDEDTPDCPACLRAKVELFDVLAARIVSDDWHVTPGINRNEVVIYDHSRGERVHGATLAEAVEKAMRAEGGAR